MKKLVGIIFICMAVTALGAGEESQRYSSVALSYDMNYEPAQEGVSSADTRVDALGISWVTHAFEPGKSVGSFTNLALFKPTSGTTINKSGVETTYSLANVDLCVGQAFNFGSCVRLKTKVGLELIAGIGPAVYLFYLAEKGEGGAIFQIGVAGDINLIIDLGGNQYLDLGVRGQSSIFAYSLREGDSKGVWSKEYTSYSINPRLGIGWKY